MELRAKAAVTIYVVASRRRDDELRAGGKGCIGSRKGYGNMEEGALEQEVGAVKEHAN